jgi:replicative DNA helicase
LPSNELYNSEAESFLLAAIIRNPEEYYAIVGNLGIGSQDFVGTETRRVATAIDEVVAERKNFSLPDIVESLKYHGYSDSIEFVSRLSSLPCSVPQAHEYARTVKGLSVSRKLANTGAKIIEIAREERADFEGAITRAESELRKVTRIIPAPERSPDPADILARMRADDVVKTTPILFSPTLQRVTGGWRSTELWVVGGFSSTGKSTVAANMILDMIESRKSVALFNVEMSSETYMTRLLSIKSGVPQRTIRDRVTVGHEQTKKLEDAAEYLSKSSLKIYDTIGSISGIENEARKISNREGLDILVLDYIQSIRGATGDEVKDAREVAIALQSLAKELDIVVVAFSQVSNQYAQDDVAAGGKGQYYSLKGHGSIRDNADVVIMLRRANRSQSPLLDFQIAKYRHGELMEFTCWMELSTGRIWESDSDEET